MELAAWCVSGGFEIGGSGFGKGYGLGGGDGDVKWSGTSTKARIFPQRFSMFLTFWCKI